MSDTTAVNQAYFNKLASEYDQKFQKTVGLLEEEVKSRAEMLGGAPGGRLLDYACGTGLLSRSLGAQLSQCIGIDLSESMVEQYNAKAKSQGFSEDKRFAYAGNLITPSDPSPDAFSSSQFYNFDLAGIGLGFHHFDNCDLAAKRLAERLRPGGVLFIVDFVAHAPAEGHGHMHGVTHHGFTENQVRSMFEGAGVGKNFKFEPMKEDVVFEKAHGEKDMVRRVFFARGEKEATGSQI